MLNFVRDFVLQTIQENVILSNIQFISQIIALKYFKLFNIIYLYILSRMIKLHITIIDERSWLY